MARQVILKGKKPKLIKVGEEIVEICTCGLSKNFPICDNSHEKTIDELEDDNIIYVYDDNNNKTGAYDKTEDMIEENGCCGGGCCSNNLEKK